MDGVEATVVGPLFLCFRTGLCLRRYSTYRVPYKGGRDSIYSVIERESGGEGGEMVVSV